MLINEEELQGVCENHSGSGYVFQPVPGRRLKVKCRVHGESEVSYQDAFMIGCPGCERGDHYVFVVKVKIDREEFYRVGTSKTTRAQVLYDVQSKSKADSVLMEMATPLMKKREAVCIKSIIIETVVDHQVGGHRFPGYKNCYLPEALPEIAKEINEATAKHAPSEEVANQAIFNTVAIMIGSNANLGDYVLKKLTKHVNSLKGSQ